MNTKKFSNDDKGREEWLESRIGKITGTRVKDILVKRGTGKKIGFYEIIAERIALPPSNENPMDRGLRLEDEAVARFEKMTGKKVNTDLVLWMREDNPDIALSPDGAIGKTEAVEIKCLSTARHIEAYLTKEIPPEYYDQAIQYFVVNDKLKTLYFIMYDPRCPIDIFWVTLNRIDIGMQIAASLEYQRNTLAEIESIIPTLTF